MLSVVSVSVKLGRTSLLMARHSVLRKVRGMRPIGSQSW